MSWKNHVIASNVSDRVVMAPFLASHHSTDSKAIRNDLVQVRIHNY